MTTKNDVKMDRRTRRTRLLLQEALLRLLADKPLNRITVTELTELADVNRVTFYAHYHDVYDMFDQLRLDLIEMYTDMTYRHTQEMCNGDYRPFIREVYMSLDGREQLLSLLSTPSGGNLYADIIDAISKVCTETVAPQITLGIGGASGRAIGIDGAAAADDASSTDETTTDQMTVDPTMVDPTMAKTISDYQFGYIAGGVVNMLKDWFRRGRRESIELMVGMTSNLISHSGREVYRENLKLLERMPGTAGTH
ncbi:TetR family transcriptional regulator [Bifidobacterium callitrichos DSM 23973]|uniref:TetR family transcriptional regulator n=2 Tax=Bifidobacterium callitrichos TaxID=762209 RepID=A0A087A236_9BIFI|nr:TetR-like C-terminal domain-containing protein [Bifidobacterium callitrichos]KFI52836.1 TetR family transcriptional regulator [Bifidobacterium callitrichos DSM 23973]